MRGRLRTFQRSEDGSATIEFAIMVPLYLLLLLATFELGMLMCRQVMLDRALDLTVRDIRLGTIAPVTHTTIRDALCDHAIMIPDCRSQIRLEMRPIDPRAWVAPPGNVDCIDRADDTRSPRSFVAGAANQLMFLRACALFDPYVPDAGLGEHLPRESGDAYALVSTAAYVLEPL